MTARDRHPHTQTGRPKAACLLAASRGASGAAYITVAARGSSGIAAALPAAGSLPSST